MLVINFKVPPTTNELFNIAVAGVLSQGVQCLDESGECQYRGSTEYDVNLEPIGETTACAVGWLITDEVYTRNSGSIHSEMISDGLCNKTRQCVEESIGRKLLDFEAVMLRSLQYCHDCAINDVPQNYSRASKLSKAKSLMAAFLYRANKMADKHSMPRYRKPS